MPRKTGLIDERELYPGIKSYDVNLEKEEVMVTADEATYEYVLEKIKKTGKEVIFTDSL